MGIKVNNDIAPGYAALAGYAAGDAEKKRKAAQMSLEAWNQSASNWLTKKQMDESSRQFNDELAFRSDQNALNRDTQFALQDRAYGQRMNEMFISDQLNQQNRQSDYDMDLQKADYENKLYKERTDYQYSAQQKQKFQQNETAIKALQSNPASMGLTPEQAKGAIEQLKRQNLGIMDSPESFLPEKNPYPEGKGIGQIWSEGDLTVTRKPDGSVQTLYTKPNTGLTPKDKVGIWADISAGEGTLEEKQRMYQETLAMIEGGELPSKNAATGQTGEVPVPTAQPGAVQPTTNPVPVTPQAEIQNAGQALRDAKAGIISPAQPVTPAAQPVQAQTPAPAKPARESESSLQKLVDDLPLSYQKHLAGTIADARKMAVLIDNATDDHAAAVMYEEYKKKLQILDNYRQANLDNVNRQTEKSYVGSVGYQPPEAPAAPAPIVNPQLDSMRAEVATNARKDAARKEMVAEAKARNDARLAGSAPKAANDALSKILPRGDVAKKINPASLKSLREEAARIDNMPAGKKRDEYLADFVAKVQDRRIGTYLYYPELKSGRGR